MHLPQADTQSAPCSIPGERDEPRNSCDVEVEVLEHVWENSCARDGETELDRLIATLDRL